MAARIYLHWTATSYDWIRPGHYHSIITGDGLVHRLHSYSVDLPAHTWQRNSNSVALGRNHQPHNSSKAFAQKRLLSLGAGVGARLISTSPR